MRDTSETYETSMAALEEAILDLLSQRSSKASICPSEVARRAFSETEWRQKMELVRKAGRRLAARERIDVLQKGNPVDPESAKGPIRYRLPSGSR